MSSTIQTSACTVFVQVWVDVNALQQNSTAGCYAVCNQSQSSTGNGTANLSTNVITGSNVCWSVLPIDPQYTGDFTITSIGTESGWSLPPLPIAGNPATFTGQLTESTVGGNVNSNIVFSFNGSGGSNTITLPVTITPVTV
jgi:hypothetical protein